MKQDICDWSRFGGVEYRKIPGFSNYVITEHGDIISLSKKNRKSDIVIRPSVDSSNGYKFVSITGTNGRQITKKVHQLVALAFLGKRPNNMVVCHCDSNKMNNHYRNLRYDTQYGNIQDYKAIRATSVNYKKIDIAQRKALVEYLREKIKSLYDLGYGITDISKITGYSLSGVSRIVHGSRGNYRAALPKICL